MRAAENKRKVISSALLLGVLALVTNTFSYLVSPDHSIPFGNVFLFWSAGALGIVGAAVSAAISILPDIIFTEQYIYATRIFILTCALGYSARKFPKLPGYVATMMLWLCVFAPVLTILRNIGMSEHSLTMNAMLHSALGEVCLAIASGLLLMSPAVWASVSQAPRHIELPQLLMHLLALFSVGPFFLLISLHGSALVVALRMAPGWGPGLLGLLSVCAVILPVLAGWWLSEFLYEYAPITLRNGRNNQRGFVQKRGGIQDSSDEGSLADRAVEPYWHTTKREAPRSVSTGQIGAFQLSTEGIILLADEDFYKIVDLEGRDLEGTPLGESELTQEFSDKVLAIKDASLTHGNQETEIRVSQRPDSNHFYKIRTLVHGKGENDRGEISVKVFIEDVTESRTVHSHLMQAQKLSSLSNVVSGLAHTFNNSLTTIIGQASFARAQKDPDKTTDALQKVIDTAQKSSELIWKLIEFCESKPEKLKSNDLGMLLKENQELLQKIAGEQHSLDFTLQKEGSPILCDESLLVQAMSNLIINAKEAYGTQRGKIEISLDTETLDQTAASLVAGSRPGTYARIRVKDSGSGMTNDVVARACEPLFSTRHGSGQAGLGLAMVFSIARAHDGFLTIESQSGKGTSVTLYVPLDETTMTATSTEETKKSVPAINALRESVNHERILVVEDEPSVRSLVEKMLSSLGYEVLACCDGEEALQKFQEETFDLVLVDMMMPKMNGTELLKLLQEKNSETRALIMTGYGVRGVPEDTSATVLPKPFDMQTLASTVYDALHSG